MGHPLVIIVHFGHQCENRFKSTTCNASLCNLIRTTSSNHSSIEGFLPSGLKLTNTLQEHRIFQFIVVINSRVTHTCLTCFLTNYTTVCQLTVNSFADSIPTSSNWSVTDCIVVSAVTLFMIINTLLHILVTRCYLLCVAHLRVLSNMSYQNCLFTVVPEAKLGVRAIKKGKICNLYGIFHTATTFLRITNHNLRRSIYLSVT